jgi:hypothetical protein
VELVATVNESSKAISTPSCSLRVPYQTGLGGTATCGYDRTLVLQAEAASPF